MKSQRLFFAAALVMSFQGIHAQSTTFPAEEAELFRLLRKQPAQAVIRDGERVDVVDGRFEPCLKKKDACYIRVITPVADRYDVRVMTPHGAMLMRGSTTDALGRIPDGPFLYYDEAGTLRADGCYVQGRKTGTWHRYDDRGRALPDKDYLGLDWDSMEVKLGLATMSAQLDELAGN